MNNERRKAIAQIQRQIEELMAGVEQALANVESIRDEEQDYFDAMPESLQGGDRGQRAEEVIGYLEEAVSALEDISFDDVIAQLDEAAA